MGAKRTANGCVRTREAKSSLLKRALFGGGESM